MEEDWGLNSNAPSFSLFVKTSPEEEAKKDSLVDSVVYNRWTKAERRLYQKRKTEKILKLIQEENLNSIDDLSMALDSLSMFKEDSNGNDALIDDLINKVSRLKVSVPARNAKPTI